MDVIQWLAGAGLVYFGLDELARHAGSLAEPGISAFSERFRHLPGNSIITGIPAGISMQGRRGRDYLKRRRFPGLLTRAQMTGMTVGMSIGMMLPALMVLLLPGFLRFPVLLAGVVLRMTARQMTGQSTGRALIGLGCCWIGFSTCQTIVHGGFEFAVLQVTALAFATAFLSKAPVPLWLILSTTPTGNHPVNAFILAMATITGWVLSVLAMRLHGRTPFNPRECLIDYRTLSFPESALQAALQEIRRLAFGLSNSTTGALPELMKGNPTGLKQIRAVESAVDEVKAAVLRFLGGLTHRRLNEHQARLLLHLTRCMSDLERIGDHIEALASTAANRPSKSNNNQETSHEKAIITLTAATVKLLNTVAQSISGLETRTETAAKRILEQRIGTLALLQSATDTLAQEMEKKQIRPADAVHERELLSHFERIVRHAYTIAMTEQQPDFWIDPDAMHLRVNHDNATLPPPVNQQSYLNRIQKEEEP